MLWKIRIELIRGISLLIPGIKWVPSVSTPDRFLSGNCALCSPHEELQQYWACHLKKKEVLIPIAVLSTVTAAGTWWKSRGYTTEQGCNMNRALKLERILHRDDWGNYWRRDVLHLHSFCFWRILPDILIFFHIPICNAMILIILYRLSHQWWFLAELPGNATPTNV